MTIRKAFAIRVLTCIAGATLVGCLMLPRSVVFAASENDCSQLPSHADLKAALTAARQAQ